MAETTSVVDIVGVGLNATDTIIRLPHFPAFNSKVEFRVSEILPGRPGGHGRHGLRALGTEGSLRRKDRRRSGRRAPAKRDAKVRDRGALDRRARIARASHPSFWWTKMTGERTVLWKRDPRLELLPSEIEREWVVQAQAPARRWPRLRRGDRGGSLGSLGGHSGHRRPRQSVPGSGSFT